MKVDIPAQWVASGHGVPDVCARHGRPAVRRQRLRIISRPPGWTVALIAVNLLIYTLVVLAIRKSVTAPAWPLCTQCVAYRRRLRRALMILLGAALVSVVSSVTLTGPLRSQAGGPALLPALVLLVPVIVVLARLRWAAIAGAHVSRDGYSVWVKGCADFGRTALAIQQTAHLHPPAYARQRL